MADRLLIADDERDITDMLARFFRERGYDVLCAYTGVEAVRAAGSKPDLILLDVGLPDIDGLEVCRLIREHVSCPIIFLTARVEESDKLRGFAAELTTTSSNPSPPASWPARVDAHLRREKRHMTASEVRFDGALAINYSDRSVTYNGEAIQFARREFDIIEFLSQDPGLVFDRERMYEAIWGLDGEGDSGVIAEHIRRIRAKLAAAGAQKQYIETVWGVGYKWAK